MVFVDLIILFEKPRKDHGHAGAHLEFGSVHCDLHRIRNLQIPHFVFGLLACLCLCEKMFRVILDALKAVSHSGECHTDNDSIFSLRNDRTVVHFNVFDIVIGENDTGHYREGDVDVLVTLRILIVDVNGHFSGLAGQFFRRDLLPLQIISDLLKDRRLLVCGSLIINIVSVCFPGQ